ncbi:protein shortage in chiasmata 1 ortholog [Porphyrio hochstetteri]
MLKTSENKMFAALKYHSTDYLYESMARQKFSIWRLSLCFPPCLHQDEKYHLTGLFADDKYRKPWIRITSTQNIFTSVESMDQWKKSLSVEDFLERKPVASVEFYISNELTEVIPSSNPSSLTDIEGSLLLMENVFKEESTQDKYLKTDYATEFKEQQQDFCIEEELVFIDHLQNFRKRLPTLSVLLSRLNYFVVKDPLLDSEGQKLIEDNIFRECLTFQNEMEMQESKKELPGIKENFCAISVKDGEYFMLPVVLKLCKPSSGTSDPVKIPSYLELKRLLNLTPETVAEEDMFQEMIREATYVSYLKDEMEVPLTPPCRQERSQAHFLCTELQEDPISLSGSSILLTEPSREYLEHLVWQSEKYRNDLSSLLLLEHETVTLAYQQHSPTELKGLLAAEVEAPMLCSLEEGWWLRLGLNPVHKEALEQLNTVVSNANSLLPTEAETFTRLPSQQLERWLEEKNSVSNQELLSAETCQSDKVINYYISPQTQRQCFAPHISDAPADKSNSSNRSVGDLSEGSIKEIEGASCVLNQEKKTLESSESVTHEDMSCKQDNSSSSQKSVKSQSKPSYALATKWENEDSDLNNFIMLRSKHTLPQTEEKRESPEKVLQPEEQHLCALKEDSSVSEPVRTEEREEENEHGVTIYIPASESQCQAFCLLKEAATPVLEDLTHRGVLASVNWSFDSIKFDHTRFFLKQQEKVICDRFKEGLVDEKEIMLFRHAALVHLLVTVRDLLLTCGLDTALGYLSKAKDIYKTILESCLNSIWRQLKIVQYSSQKKQETNPKITELWCQMLNWMQNYGKEHSVKVNYILIITRTDSEREKTALIHTLSGVEGLKAIDLNAEKKRIFLGCKDIISNLSRYSSVIVHNQQIGPDFPWTHFSLVVEYDYSENSCWKNLCKNLNVTYMTLKTTPPETTQMGNHYGSFLLEVQIPYVFLTTEGLLNMPDILQLLESKYSITFVERSSSYSLRLFGSTDRYVILTIDECTAIFLQSMEELNYEKSCDNIISKLMALSLQYTCCWIVFYSQERLSLKYSLRGDTLLNLALLYATLVELTQKTEDFEVKVVLVPGIEETAMIIRQIADNILIASNISPHEWLDKSWISVLPSETEKCLLDFPCINPLVAQFMLKKGSSLNRLLLASFDQLHKVLPEVPKKVLKHFSGMASSYSLNTAAQLEKAVKGASPQENRNSFNTLCPDYKQNHQSLELLGKAQNSTGNILRTSHMNSKAIIPPLNYHQGFFDPDLPSFMQKKSRSSEVTTGKKQNFFAVPKDCEDFAHLEVANSLHVQRQPFRTPCSSDQFSKISEKENFYESLSDCGPQESSESFLEEFRDPALKSPEILTDQTPWNKSSSTGPSDSFASHGFLSDFFVNPDEHQSLNFYQIGRESKGKRKQNPPFLWAKETTRTDSGFVEVPELKKRRLSYERVPGRSDGQTRLKFF